jgi:hypothetical protein
MVSLNPSEGIMKRSLPRGWYHLTTIAVSVLLWAIILNSVVLYTVIIHRLLLLGAPS